MSDGSMGESAAVRPRDRRALALFALAMAVYLTTRLYALDRFPIFFHADEAFGPLTAASLLTNGLSDAYQRLLPVYFEPAPNRWMPIGTVYAHLLTVALFGKSIIATRATTALVTAVGAAAVALALRDGFHARRWWAGALVLGAMPTWFLHSRTGFEAAMMTAAFAVFLWTYLRYRQDGGRIWSCAAVTAGAATFYAYSNGQSLMAVLGILLLLVDGRFHWSQRRALGPALALGLVLLIPFARFRLAHPGAEIEHLRAIDSYIVDPAASAGDKALGFARRYAFGLHPRFWFISHDGDNPLQWAEDRWPAIRPALMLGGNLDIERHRYRGRGHIALWMLPFFAVGLVGALRRWRSPAHRTVLLAVLATPFGAATAGVGVTRVLAFVVPAAVLITLGIEAVIDVAGRWLARDRASTRGWASSVAAPATRWPGGASGAVTGLCFIALAGANVELLTTALRTGDRWYDDYGLYGMQWGAAQLFDDMIPSLLATDPDVKVLVTSDWANAADRLPYFFLDFEQTRRVRSRSVSDPLTRLIELSDDEIWIVTDHELDGVRKSGKFAPPEIVRTLNWPDGRPGFHAVRLRYAAGVDKVFAAERAERRKLVEAAVVLDGQNVVVRHSVSDMGSPAELFDGDPSTLLRGMEANPLIIEMAFPTPRALTGIAAHFAHMPFTWSADLFAPDADEPVTYAQTVTDVPDGDAHGDLAFDAGPAAVSRLKLTIHQDDLEDEAHIHVRELRLR